MAGKKKFVIETPRGAIYTTKTKDGTVTAKLEWAQRPRVCRLRMSEVHESPHSEANRRTD